MYFKTFQANGIVNTKNFYENAVFLILDVVRMSTKLAQQAKT